MYSENKDDAMERCRNNHSYLTLLNECLNIQNILFVFRAGDILSYVGTSIWIYVKNSV